MKLIGRARNLMRGLAPVRPARTQPYSVACSSGHRLRGERTDGYQALPCPTCGERLFILPRSPLPEPPEAHPTTRSRSSSRAASLDPAPTGPVSLVEPIESYDAPPIDADAEIEWADEPPQPDPDPDPVADPVPATRRPKAESRPRPSPATRHARPRPQPQLRPKDEPAVRVEPSIPLQTRLAGAVRRHRHPLLFLGVLLVVVATVGYRWRWSRIMDAPRVAEIGRTQGLAALDEGRYDTAHQLLADAKRAVEALGGAVEGASEIRQGADEAEVYVNLTDGLETLLAEARRTDPKEWPARFARLYQGRTIILDADVAVVPGGDSDGVYALDYLIVPDGEGDAPPTFGRIDTAGFSLLEETIRPRVGDRVTFGARLASFAFDGAAELWRIGLEPESGVSLTRPKALAAACYRSFDGPRPREPAP